jgi:alanine racemase
MRGAWIEVDLEAYRANLAGLRESCGGRPVLAVVKANAYGHGLVRMAQAAVAAGCPGVAVARPEEGLALRAAGFQAPVLVLGLWPLEQAAEVVRAGLDCVVAQAEAVAALAAARERGDRVRVHLKVDTGMTRVGVAPEAALAFVEAILARPQLSLAGVMTHFASADEDPEATAAQWARFQPVIAAIAARAPERPLFHAANSAAALWFPPARLDLIRPGLASYGVLPVDGRSLPFRPQPVLSLHGQVAAVRWVEAGARVGYGGTYVTTRRSRLGVVPLGYGDGLPWRCAGRLSALVQGRRVPVVGRISMDQVVLDLTDIPYGEPGERATFIGRQGDEEIRVTDLACAAGTIPYEILTGMAARLPRVYREES